MKGEVKWRINGGESDAPTYSFLFLLILFLFHLFIVKEQVTNDFAIVKPTKQYANLTNNPTPFAIIQFKGIDYG